MRFIQKLAIIFFFTVLFGTIGGVGQVLYESRWRNYTDQLDQSKSWYQQHRSKVYTQNDTPERITYRFSVGAVIGSIVGLLIGCACRVDSDSDQPRRISW